MIKLLGLSDIKTSEKNPRYIDKDDYERLLKSLKEFPQMLWIRPIVSKDGIALAGNMKYKAIQEIFRIAEGKRLALHNDIEQKIWSDRRLTDSQKQESIEQANTFLMKKRVPVFIADGLTDEQAAEFMIKDNTHFGKWDFDMLGNEWDEMPLQDWGVVLPSFDMDEEGSEGDNSKSTPQAEEDNFEVPEVEEIKTDIVLGDLIEFKHSDGRYHRLLCGDSTKVEDVEKLMDGGKIDIVFTSPPYNAGNTTIGFEKKNGKGLKSKTFYENVESDIKTSSEYLQFNESIFANIERFSNENCVILYNINYNKNSPSEYIDIVHSAKLKFNLVETIVWKKQLAISLAGNNLTRIYEFIFVFYNGRDKPNVNKVDSHESINNFWEISNVGANNEFHKACFPIALVSKGIGLYSQNKDNCFEPFCGSGSTMVAAHQLNRKCYGIELDPKYCEVIVQRMRKIDSGLTILKNGIEI
jgi:DNA modification methylase